ncbi:MAG: sigma 54-dependent Fis family transcriptional regulator [Deltaproteobacteria bacterium]|nr:sigma 54-dependent Fis family transcriptional regulator [Deltaproteobacteria bacterium]
METRAMQVEPTGLSLQRCNLVQIEGPDPGSVFPVQGDKLVVGKSADADWTVEDLTVSRLHFEIRSEGGRYLIKDLGSTNGTELDGARVREAFVRPGAIIKAGEVVFRFLTEYDAVRIEPSGRERFGALRGRSVRMREIFAMLERVAGSDATVLLLGPTGTGKGAAAAALHGAGPRASKAFVVVDCGAVARNLIESELFGHVKGAYTGATSQRRGALEEAHGGTLFLDELDDLPLDLQPKLLRAIEERVFVRLGSNQPVPFDARLVAASKKDLWMEVAAGRFREDLYYRLSVVTIRLPALRERAEDIPLLFDHFVGEDGPRFEELDEALRQRWMSHSWPGNVRELRNAVERSRALQGDGLSGAFHVSGRSLPASGGLVPDYGLPFKEAKERLVDAFEREYLSRLLERSSGNLSSTAREAGIDRKYLYALLDKHGLDRPGRKG